MPTFQYVQPTEYQRTVMQAFRDQFETLSDAVGRLEDSRGKSLALTKLEESAMWINKAITKND